MVRPIVPARVEPLSEAALLHVVLVEPQIPPNTGNIARLCAALELPLHLVGRLGFSLDDRYLKRAGLDYWPAVELYLWPDAKAFFDMQVGHRLHWFSRHADVEYTAVEYHPGDLLVFGSEVSGLPGWLKSCYPGRGRRLPMRNPAARSLNLSSAAAVAAYEAFRQLRGGGTKHGRNG